MRTYSTCCPCFLPIPMPLFFLDMECAHPIIQRTLFMSLFSCCSREERLRLAARDGRLETVRNLLSAGANPNYLGRDESALSYGYTALHYAANRGHADVVRELLAAGADKECVKVGETPMMMARNAGRPATSGRKHHHTRRQQCSSMPPRIY